MLSECHRQQGGPVGEMQAKPGLERWLSTVALATFAYYLVTFAFEVGFFWPIGIPYLSAFSAAEHTIHAAAYIIGTFGVVAFAVVAFGVPQSLIKFSSRPARQEELEANGVSTKTLVISWLLRAPALIVFLYIIFVSIDDIYQVKPNPGNVFGLLAAVTMFVYTLDGSKYLIKRAWIIPAFLLAVITPFSLGYAVYYTTSRSIYGSTVVELENKKHSAEPIFIGIEKGIYKIQNRLFVISSDGKLIMQIVPPGERKAGTAPPRAQANR